MEKILDFLRTIKATYVINNLFNRKKLVHNVDLYEKYKLRKSIFTPISSQHFKDKPPLFPWLDQPEAKELLNLNEDYQQLSPEMQQKVIQWIDQGYMILEGFFNEAQVTEINQEVDELIARKAVGFHPSGRIMFAYRQSQLMQEVVNNKEIIQLLSFLLGKRVHPFQSINFIKGSEQKPHSDSIHMTTYPLGYLAAIWIALESISEENGGLIYYPGSHKLPYILNADFDHGGNSWRLGNNANQKYEEKIQAVIDQHGLKPKVFRANPGDLLIWHANLIHGGLPIQKEGSTRKSMVVHYFTEDVICYHELTQRPALLPLEEVV
ncbi:MAG: phytanoyl-CoA dioxygenase family protein [Bacteroidia bacterium]